MTKVTYLEHSGFFIELDDCCLLFDYYQGEIPHISHKPLYVFVSHIHHDHYQECIFQLSEDYDQVFYILSDDIPEREDRNCLMVQAEQKYHWNGLLIETLQSTDEGVAFLINVANLVIYHAGDLNWWHWEEENTPQENDAAKAAYLKNIQRLKNRHIDLAFVVLDPRQEDEYYYGMEAFFRTCKPDVVFPMHMWGDYGIIQDIKKLPQMVQYRDKIIEIHHAEEEFII